MPDPSTYLTYGGATAVVGAISFGIHQVIRLARSVWPLVAQAQEFFGDWRGREARPGVDAQPGVMARLQSVEQVGREALDNAARAVEAVDQARSESADGITALRLEQAAHASQLGVIVDAVGQLQKNKGSTMRDQLARIEGDTAAAAGRPIPPQALHLVHDHHAHPHGGTP